MTGARRQLIFWVMAFAVFIGLVAVFRSVLLPFVLGMAVAYLLNPLVQRLCRAGLSRSVAALALLAAFFLALALFAVAVVPLFYKETLDLAQNIPLYVDQLRGAIEPLSHKLQHMLGQKEPVQLQTLMDQASPTLGFANKMLFGLIAGGQAAIHIVSVIVITPIVAYFMMKEWMNITSWAEGILPRKNQETIMGLLREIDCKLAGFVRGQLGVMLVLGTGYAVALTLAGLKYGFLIGVTSGLLSVIPMAGSAVGFMISVTVAFFQTGDWMFVLLIGGIFLAGQLIEGNLLTPFLVGGRVGLHPLWVFFALMAGGSLFGILGMLLAVPVAAVAGVLLSFGLRQYKASPYYKGKE